MKFVLDDIDTSAPLAFHLTPSIVGTVVNFKFIANKTFQKLSIFRCASISSTHDDQIFGQVTRLWVWPTGTTQTESNSRAISYRTGVSQPTLPLDNLYQFLQLPLLALWRLTPSRLTFTNPNNPTICVLLMFMVHGSCFVSRYFDLQGSWEFSLRNPLDR